MHKDHSSVMGKGAHNNTQLTEFVVAEFVHFVCISLHFIFNCVIAQETRRDDLLEVQYVESQMCTAEYAIYRLATFILVEGSSVFMNRQNLYILSAFLYISFRMGTLTHNCWVTLIDARLLELIKKYRIII